MTDIVERLRAASYGSHGLKAEAADEIERLRVRVIDHDHDNELLIRKLEETIAARERELRAVVSQVLGRGGSQ